jgi:hypothetical protein
MSNKFLPNPLDFERLDDFLSAIAVAAEQGFLTVVTAKTVDGEISVKLTQIEMPSEGPHKRALFYNELIDIADDHSACMGVAHHD